MRSRLLLMADGQSQLKNTDTKRWRWLKPLRAGVWLPFILAALPALALNPDKGLLQYNCRAWTRQNGLPANGVKAIAQTRDGYLWLGTAQGLVRFDGVEFKLAEMPKSPSFWTANVTCLASSKNGGLWFGLYRNAFGFYGDDASSYLGRREWGGRDLNVESLLESKDGALWIASEHMAARLTGGTNFTAILGSTNEDNICHVTSLLEDSRGRIWLGTAKRGIYRWQAGTLARLTNATLDQRIVFDMAEDPEGRIWLGTEMGLVCCNSNLEEQAVAPLTTEIRALLVDRQGVLWIGTSGNGLVRRHHNRNEVFQRKDGLTDDFVTALAEDREGSIWVGTRDGLNQFTDVKFPTFSLTNGVAGKEVLSVSASRKGGVWATTETGLTYFDGTNAINYSTGAGFQTPYLKQSLEARNGDLYLINGNMDVEIFSDGKVVARHPNPTWPVSMTEDAQGVVVAVGANLFRAGRDYFTPYPFPNDRKPLLKWVVNMMTGRDGSLWIAGVNGICRVKDGQFKQWTEQDGLSDTRVNYLCEDRDGVIWAGMQSGIVRLKDNQIRNIGRNDGLLDDGIQAMVFDDHGFLWADSSRGLFKVSRQSLNDFADGKTNHVTCVDYKRPAAVKPADWSAQENSCCRTPDGRIWFPSSKGVVVINPSSIPLNRVGVQVDIYRVRANGLDLAGSKEAVIPPGRGDLEFYYTAPSFIAPQAVQFQYWLEGYDQNPKFAENRRLALYTNLKPGKYTFHVIAANADGVWNDNGDSVEIRLLPHYYQTFWFYSLCGGLVCVVLAGIYAWRIKHLRNKEFALQIAHDQLETEVQKRTTELAETVTSLRYEVRQRVLVQSELEVQKTELEAEIEERKRMELEVERIHRELVDASRQAGQAEVASSVLHNVGNVLNSVNVSTALIRDHLDRLRSSNLEEAAQMIREHADDLGRFLTTDEKGRHFPRYLSEVTQYLSHEQEYLLNEINGLAQNVEHINEIVAMQQNYASVSGVHEKVAVSEVVENGITMNLGAFSRHGINVVREYEPVEFLTVDKHKVLQILVNILRNAKYACDESGSLEKEVTVRIKRAGDGRVQIEIADNGVGIAPENLTRIFSHGFTTRKHGHGFGLHSSALAAKEMGGTLTVQSEGVGEGATFILELPLCPPESAEGKIS
jgi:ligand-binding sensor domain-containing protein/signal transduction histidine kinase